jgi:hypothetical protein
MVGASELTASDRRLSTGSGVMEIWSTLSAHRRSNSAALDVAFRHLNGPPRLTNDAHSLVGRRLNATLGLATSASSAFPLNYHRAATGPSPTAGAETHIGIALFGMWSSAGISLER